MTSIGIVGRGRAGASLALAIARAGGQAESVSGREVDPDITGRFDLVVLAVPDAAVAEVAARLTPRRACAVAHCSGSLGLDVLVPHQRVASIHPLASLPDPELGADRLRGAWFAVSGDPVVGEIVELLGGRPFVVDDRHRAAYHAAAVVASNHLVALLGQVERLAAAAGVPVEALGPLIEGSLANAEQLGAAAALTGPVARGDWDTVRRHLGAIDRSERATYLALAVEAARLAGTTVPPDLGPPAVAPLPPT